MTFDRDLERGQQSEFFVDHIIEIFKADSGRAEIKRDAWWPKTGRLAAIPAAASTANGGQPEDQHNGQIDRQAKSGSHIKQASWRDVLPVHPAAELFPVMSEGVIKELGEDIKKNGLRSPVVLWRDYEGHLSLLDGRNRLDAKLSKANIDDLRKWAEVISNEGRKLVSKLSEGIPDFLRRPAP
jgi:hypothetical protein